MGTALVTGASSGIGKELARCFAAGGHDVVLVARRLPLLEALASELSARHGKKMWPIACDLSTPDAVRSLLGDLSTRGLEIDFLVNNAGFGTTGLFAHSPLERELRMAEVNVTTVVHLTRALLPGMLARRRGRILNVGSTAGFQPGPYMATYYASKAFVNHFSEALFEELRGTGVTVTVSCPGPTQTEFGELSGVGKANLFRRMPVANAERVAREAYEALFAGRALVVHGFLNRVGVVAIRFGWRSLVRRIIGFLNRPPELHGST